MRTEVTKTLLYTFEELPKDVQQNAIEGLRDINTYYEWWDFVFDDSKRLAAMIGIDIDDIYFSGFWSQGDGAQFTGSYEYRKGGAKELKAEAPQDTELHAIADGLQEIQRRHFYKLTARVKSSGCYSHEMCTDVRVYRETEYSYVGDCAADTDNTVTELLRDYMRWIYRRLESEYDYLNSDDAIRDTIIANEYEFTGDGRIH